MSYKDIRFFYLSLQIINNNNVCGRIAFSRNDYRQRNSNHKLNKVK